MKLKRTALLLALTCCISTAFAADEAKSTYDTSDGSCSAAKVVYEYKPDSLFRVNVQMGYVTDIALKPGESVTYLGAGDTKRWLIDQASVGSTSHIYIKPLAKGISTNMIINTNQRTYRLYLVSVTSNYTPIVEFSFPDEAFQKMMARPLPWKSKEEKLFYDIYMEKKNGAYALKKLNRKYKVKKHGKLEKTLYPTEIFDDGTRTYILMPQSNKYDLPVLYNVDYEDKMTLVNYRIKNGYIIADRVFRRARLCYTPKTYLDILPSDDLYGGAED